jgi:hypothetical protein
MEQSKEKMVHVLLRLSPAYVEKFDRLVDSLKAKSRNQAMGILLDSVEVAQAAKVEMSLAKKGKVKA